MRSILEYKKFRKILIGEVEAFKKIQNLEVDGFFRGWTIRDAGKFKKFEEIDNYTQDLITTKIKKIDLKNNYKIEKVESENRIKLETNFFIFNDSKIIKTVIIIYALKDDYFMVNFMFTTSRSFVFLCDQTDGLILLFKSIYEILEQFRVGRRSTF